jgi:hypothetical protein
MAMVFVVALRRGSMTSANGPHAIILSIALTMMVITSLGMFAGPLGKSSFRIPVDRNR